MTNILLLVTKKWHTNQKVFTSLVIFLMAFLFLMVLTTISRTYITNDSVFLGLSSEHLMQTLSIVDLRTSPIESLYYLHIQPPALDIIRAVVAHFWPSVDDGQLAGKVDGSLYFVWAVAYSLIMVLVYLWFSYFLKQWPAIIATIVFLLHPANIFYATLLDGTILTTLCFVWFYYELWKLRIGKTSIVLFTVSFILLFFIRSFCQWPMLIVVSVSLILLKIPKRQYIVFIFISGIIILSYTLKQYLLFDLPTTSSFAGYNFCRSLGFTPNNYFTFLQDESDHLNSDRSSIAVLRKKYKAYNTPNFNHQAYLVYNKWLLKQYIERLITQPFSETLYSYIGNLKIYLRPSSRYGPHAIVDNLVWRNIYDIVFSNWPLIILLGLALINWICTHNGENMLRKIALILPATYFFIVSILFEKGENHRFKYFLEPIMYVFIVAQIAGLLRIITRWYHRIK